MQPGSSGLSPICFRDEVPQPPLDVTSRANEKVLQLGFAEARAPERAHQPWGESPHRTEHWLSVAESNCVAERRGGEQLEANDHSISTTRLNSIRPTAWASRRVKGEAQQRRPTGKDQGDSVDRPCGETVSAGTGVPGVGGDRRVGRWGDLNQGSPAGKGAAFRAGCRPEEPCPAGDTTSMTIEVEFAHATASLRPALDLHDCINGMTQASVVAKKRGNARGAKGGREVEARRTDPRKVNRRQCRQRLHKAERSGPALAWVEPAVWTERRLATLETGIEGGKWFRRINIDLGAPLPCRAPGPRTGGRAPINRRQREPERPTPRLRTRHAGGTFSQKIQPRSG
jgi:hypothetical protein